MVVLIRANASRRSKPLRGPATVETCQRHSPSCRHSGRQVACAVSCASALSSTSGHLLSSGTIAVAATGLVTFVHAAWAVPLRCLLFGLDLVSSCEASLLWLSVLMSPSATGSAVMSVSGHCIHQENPVSPDCVACAVILRIVASAKDGNNTEAPCCACHRCSCTQQSYLPLYAESRACGHQTYKALAFQEDMMSSQALHIEMNLLCLSPNAHHRTKGSCAQG